MNDAPLARARQSLTRRIHLERLPLRWRLSLAIFGLLVLLLGILGVAFSFSEEQALLRNQAGSLYDAARLVSPGAFSHDRILTSRGSHPPPFGPTPGDISSTASILTQHLSGLNIAASVLMPSGETLASSPFNAFVTTSYITPVAPSAEVLRAALTAPIDTSAYTLANGSDGQRQLFIVVPLVANNTTVALLEVSSRTVSIDHAVATLRLILFLGIGGALVLAGAFALPLVGTALRPLRQMERASRRIAGGALSLRLKEPEANDELGRLTHSFNVMIARLEEAFVRQKRFVSDVSHELRTPLTALGGGLEMLLLGADAGDPEARHLLLRGMYAETERMRRLVEDLLTLARLDEGHLPLRPDSVDVAALLRDVAEQAERLASGQTILRELLAEPLFVRADADRLRQVLLNLIENALKFTPAEGTITLAAHPSPGDSGAEGARITIAVRDTGVGIPPDALAQVFDRFYRADFARARTSDQPGGSGLGLAIAQSIVEAQGGDITIASVVGDGTTVTISLPTASASVKRVEDASPDSTMESIGSESASTTTASPR